MSQDHTIALQPGQQNKSPSQKKEKKRERERESTSKQVKRKKKGVLESGPCSLFPPRVPDPSWPCLPRISIEARKSPKLPRAAQELSRSPRLPLRKPSVGSPSLTRREFPFEDITQVGAPSYPALPPSSWGLCPEGPFLPAACTAHCHRGSLSSAPHPAHHLLPQE